MQKIFLLECGLSRLWFFNFWPTQIAGQFRVYVCLSAFFSLTQSLQTQFEQSSLQAALGSSCTQTEEHLSKLAFIPGAEKPLLPFVGKDKDSHWRPQLEFHLKETGFSFPRDAKSCLPRSGLVKAGWPLLISGRACIVYSGFLGCTWCVVLKHFPTSLLWANTEVALKLP